MTGIANFLNTDTTDPTDYPNGCLKDDVLGLTGVPVNKSTYNDIQLYFDKMLRLFSITANATFDNETNGYQSIQALQLFVNGFVAPLIQSLIPAWSSSVTYVLTGLASRSDNGVVFLNGNIYFAQGYSGPIAIGQVAGLEVNSFPISSLYGIPGMPVSSFVSAPPSTTYSNYSDLNFKPFEADAGSIGVVGTWVLGTVPARATTFNAGEMVKLDGAIKNDLGSGSSAGNIGLLPADARPARDMSFPCYYTNGGSSGFVCIRALATGYLYATDTVPTMAEIDLSPICYTLR